MVYKATNVADYVVKLANDLGDEITHLRLQKILYYIQGTFLALKGEPAFSEEILAWKLGPAVHSVFSVYTKYDKDPIPSPKATIIISDTDQLFIKEIYNRYHDYTTTQLVSKTHNEAPWKNSSESGVISNESIRSFFTDSIYNDNDFFSEKPVVTELPTELYDPAEDEEWSNY